MVTGYSGLYDGQYGTPYAPLASQHGNDIMPLTINYAGRGYGRSAERALLRALNGTAAGGTASVNRVRRKSVVNLNDNVQGGLVVMETLAVINRVTTSADQTRIDTALNQSHKPTYPVDPSGNGGGGKLGR